MSEAILNTIRTYLALLLFCTLGNVEAATRTDPVVASFDCNKAQNTYEIMVCSDYGLAAADMQMSGAYRQALILTPENDKKKRIVEEQRKWLSTISSELLEKVGSKTPSVDLKRFIDTSLRERISSLRNIKSVAGKIIILDNSPTSKAACFSLLNERNITREGENDAGQSNFTITPPSAFDSSPKWSNIGIAGHAEFDFMNIGKPMDVYFVSMQGTHIEFQYYIVATPDEKSSIEDLLRASSSMNDAMNIPEKFVYATPNTSKKNSPEFKSTLFSTSASPVYGWGWYTRTQVVKKDEITYLISSSVNNLEGPTFTIFKPHGSSLNAICYYRAPPK